MATKKLAGSKAKFDTNYATNESTARRFLKDVETKLHTTRNNRLQLDERWLEDYRLWGCQPNQEGFKGFSNIFVPELNNQVESSVEKNHGALFPGPDYIKAIATKSTKKETAQKIEDAIKYELDEKIKMGLVYDRHLRNKILFGTGLLKTGFRKDMVQAFRKTKSGRTKIVEVPRYWGVTCAPVNNFRWYIYPEMSSLDTAEIVFEDQIYSLKTAKREDIYANLDDIKPINVDIDHDWVDVEMLGIDRLSNAINKYDDSALFTEVWMEWDLIDGEDPIPVQAVIANKSTMVLLRRNPYWFQTHPYDASRYLVRPSNVFYGFSLPDKIRDQQYLMNDLMNQTMDSINYANNPIAIIDPALAGDLNSMKVHPGAKWLASPEGVQMTSFPDVSSVGLRALQEVRGQIAQFSDNTPGIAPQLQGKARSATQASLVQNAVSGRQKLQGSMEQTSVLGPVCKKAHILLQQFMDEGYQIRKQGPADGDWIMEDIQPEDLVGDVDFLWKGQSEIEKTAVYSQQLLGFYGEALKTATVMPGEIDLPSLLVRVAKEAFNLKDLGGIFKSIRAKETVNPDAENMALVEEQDTPTNPADDDQMHIATHNTVINDPHTSNKAKLMAIKHNERHRVQMQGKQQAQQMTARIEALKAAQGMVDGPQGHGGPPGDDGRMGPQVPSPMEGNQGQVAGSPASVFKGVQS